MKYSLVNPLGKTPTHLDILYTLFGHIPYPLIIDQTFALIKPIDSELKSVMDVRKKRDLIEKL